MSFSEKISPSAVLNLKFAICQKKTFFFSFQKPKAPEKQHGRRAPNPQAQKWPAQRQKEAHQARQKRQKLETRPRGPAKNQEEDAQRQERESSRKEGN